MFKKINSKMIKSEKGFSLIETLIAIVLFGMIAVAVSLGLSMAARANIISDEQTTAESLARSQIEYIQKQPYDSINNPPVYSLVSNIPAGYSIPAPLAIRLDPKNNGINNDDGLQKINITVLHGTKTIFTMEDYKVKK
jgi:prepilin-type N-terminal cleavage/methylation domain-containing protein